MDIKNPPPLAYVAKLPCERLMPEQQTIHDKLQGSVATYLRCGGLLITKLRKVYCWVCEWVCSIQGQGQELQRQG